MLYGRVLKQERPLVWLFGSTKDAMPFPELSLKCTKTDLLRSESLWVRTRASSLQRHESGGQQRGPGRPPGSSAQAAAAGGGGGSVAGLGPRGQQQVALPPEQQRWRKKLGEYLGRPVELSLLAPEAPPLDLRALWLQVGRGGRVRGAG